MFIDTHVHGRDEKQSYKETISHLLSVAERVAFSAVINIGNGDPPTTNKEAFLIYQDKAEKANSKVRFYQYILATPKPSQIEEAIKICGKCVEAAGIKIFLVHSIGDTNVSKRKDQKKVLEVLAKNKYKGVIMIHAEKEAYITKDFDPKHPITHCYNRPAISEISAVDNFLDDALEAGYEGRIHIGHVSCPETIDIKLKHALKDRLSAEAGGQHLFMHQEHMTSLFPGGLYRKKNPPLREEHRMLEMQHKLLKREIDCYGDDHAPHAEKEKTSPPYLSGFPQLPVVPLVVKKFRELGMTDKQILDYMFNNAKKIFTPKLDKVEPRKDVSLNDLEELIKEVPKLRKEYEYDAWEGIL